MSTNDPARIAETLRVVATASGCHRREKGSPDPPSTGCRVTGVGLKAVMYSDRDVPLGRRTDVAWKWLSGREIAAPR